MQLSALNFPGQHAAETSTSREVFQLSSRHAVNVYNGLWSCESILDISYVLSQAAHGTTGNSMLEQNYLAFKCFAEFSGCGGPKTL